MFRGRKKRSVLFALGSIMAGISGCGASPQGSDLISGVPIVIPTGPNGANTGAHANPEIGASCISSDPNHLCIGMRYVVYADSSANPIIPRDSIASNVAVIDLIWGQCNIGFQIDELVVANAADSSLNFNPADDLELDRARSVFASPNLLVVITTGTWNRSGSLGNTGANAWTNMPGSPVLGVVMEQPVGAYPNLIAHELGHYLNLGHVSDNSNVMNPIVYSGSTGLSSGQCDSARAATGYWWSNMLRS
jgi:hypothetical protein